MFSKTTDSRARSFFMVNSSWPYTVLTNLPIFIITSCSSSEFSWPFCTYSTQLLHQTSSSWVPLTSGSVSPNLSQTMVFYSSLVFWIDSLSHNHFLNCKIGFDCLLGIITRAPNVSVYFAQSGFSQDSEKQMERMKVNPRALRNQCSYDLTAWNLSNKSHRDVGDFASSRIEKVGNLQFSFY